ncbi:Asparagine--tRNA ligase, cytoplasmic 2 [Platanthera zijinensis]|uniref:asparagine--tRNA ligase n=1 Tax=Platanthera zijinensis TaxID=2320716 RepID=A0AAP0B1B4_9ASPA
MGSESTLSTVNEGLRQTPLMPAVERFKYSNRVLLRSILGRADGGIGLAGEKLLVGGWVKSGDEKKKPENSVTLPPAPPVVKDVTCSEILISRLPILRSIMKILTGVGCTALSPGKLDGPAKPVPTVAYLRINDGSCVFNLQIIVDSYILPLSQILPAGTSVLVEGMLERTKVAGKHAVELKVEKVLHVGSVDANKYPLSKRTLSMAFLRAYPHLCPRRTPVASVARIRNSLSHSAHQFFLSNGFINVHMPIITTTNSRAHGKVLGIASTSNKAYDNLRNVQEAKSLEVIRTAIKEKNERIEELKRSNSNKESLLIALQDLQKANELALLLEHQQPSTSRKTKEDFSENFFAEETYLSSYAQLHLECYACSLSCVYSFGPTFQAEDALSSKSLAESWKIEVELAFAELEDAMNCAEDFLMYLCHSILEHCPHDLQFIYKRIDSKCVERIKSMGSSPFARITYTEAVEILKKETVKKFEDKIEWGMNLSREHESFLADAVYQRPVIIYDYPKDSKPFYLRIRDDAKTISAFDIIAPKAGRLVQGGQKEERLEKITESVRKLGLGEEDYDWYLDLRRHGTVKHSGFSAGFEEIVMFVTGLDDIRDTIPFPRTRGSTDT